MKQNRKLIPGFTLIEILVVIFMVAMIAVIGGDILISILRSSNKTNILNEISQNADFVLNSIEAIARNAKCTYYSGSNLVIIDEYNQRNEFRLATEAIGGYNVGVVQKDTAGGGFFTLTNSNPVSGVNVVTANSSFNIINPDPTCAAVVNPLIEVTLNLTQGLGTSQRIDYKADSTFKRTIGLRNY